MNGFDDDELDDDEFDPEFFDREFLLPECAMGPDGFCAAAGSEDCDECPRMQALLGTRHCLGASP